MTFPLASAQSPKAIVEAWLQTSNLLLSGLNHSFSNRLTVLRAVISLSEATVPPRSSGEIVDDEVDTLENLLGLYRLLAFADRMEAEGSRVADAMGDTISLAGHASGSESITYIVVEEQDTQPVLVSAVALTQALLQLILAACRQRGRGNGARSVTLTVNGDADWVTVSAQVTGESRSAEADVTAELGVAQWLTRDAEGSALLVPAAGGGVRAELRLATLTRQRERARAMSLESVAV